MSVDIMTVIKQQAATLTAQEKLQLANYLLEQASLDQQPRSNRGTMEQAVRRGRIEWLKAHREVYSGQYVALDGTQLVAIGPNYRVARKGACAAGKPQAFITHVSKPDEVAEWGGWG
ncbi:MAG: hypothetical protein OEU26_30960 [Candidatus Tectomicrobia bacterium]|nr:hypothetical protein [Candidatus Tectomicrobia bacterium]